MGEWFHADEPGPGKSRKGRTPRRGGQVEGMAERGWVCLPRGVKAAGGDRALGSGEPAGWLSRRGLFEAVCTVGQGIALLCLSNLLQKLPKQLPAQPLGELSLDPPPTPSTCHPRSHLCAASLPSEAVSPRGRAVPHSPLPVPSHHCPGRQVLQVSVSKLTPGEVPKFPSHQQSLPRFRSQAPGIYCIFMIKALVQAGCFPYQEADFPE